MGVQKAREEREHYLKLIFKSSLLFFVGLAFAKLCNYGYRILIARELGPAEYGLFSISVMVAGWFIALSTLGLNEGLLRYIPHYKGTREQKKIVYLLSLSSRFLLCSSLLAAIVLFFSAPFIATHFFHTTALIPYLRLFSLSVPLLVLAHPFLALMRSYGYVGEYSFFFNIVQSGVKLLLLFLFLRAGVVFAVPYSYLIGLAFVTVGTYLFCRYRLPSLFVEHALGVSTRARVRSQLSRYSFPLLLTAIVSTLFYWIDTFSLGYYRDPVAVGLYNAAIPLAALLAIVPELFVQLFFPLINQQYAQKKSALIASLSTQVTHWILLCTLPLLITLLLIPAELLYTFFGLTYTPAAPALRLLAVSALLSALGVVASQLINMTGKTRIQLTLVLCSSVLNLALNSLFIPQATLFGFANTSGLLGAAFATTLSILFLTWSLYWYVWRYTSIVPLGRSSFRVLLAGMIAYACGYWFVHAFMFPTALLTSILTLLVVLLVYAFALTLVGAFAEGDKVIVTALVRKLGLANSVTK